MILLHTNLSNLAIKYQINMYQKYLERGHTQMECDSTHSLIEGKIKDRKINLPSEFVTLYKEGRICYQTHLMLFILITNFS